MKEKTREGMAELASERSNIYGLLSLIFRQEPTLELLRQLRKPAFVEELSEFGLGMGEDFLEGEEEEVLEELILEYTRLFLGPGRHISPHESVHRAGEGLLWGESTVRVKRFIESLELEYREDYKGIPDHISVELELLQRLTEREAEAWGEGDAETALGCLRLERQFIEEHLTKWVPPFCDQVVQEARVPFYREMAKLTKEYILEEAKQVRDLLGQYSKEKLS